MPANGTAFVSYAWPRFCFCQWCLRYLENRQAATCDHLVPTSRGGSEAWSNLIVSCHQCNNERGDTMPGTGVKAWFLNPDGSQGSYDKPHGPLWLDTGRKRRGALRREHIKRRDHCATGAHLSKPRPIGEPAPLESRWHCNCERCQEFMVKLGRDRQSIKRFAVIEPPRMVKATMIVDGEVITTGAKEVPLGAPTIVVAAPEVPPELIKSSTAGPQRLQTPLVMPD